MFRNETQATERRARKANKKALAQKLKQEEKNGSKASGGDKSTVDIKPSKEMVELLLANPAIPVEEQAKCHFMSNFVLIPRQGSTRGFLDFVVPLLRQEEGGDLHLRHAFAACALAHLNNRVNAGEQRIGEKALLAYTKALNSTNTALRDPEAQKADGTLAAILLLGLFEVSRHCWTMGTLDLVWESSHADQLAPTRRISQQSRWAC